MESNNSNNSNSSSTLREKIWNGKLLVKIEVPEHYVSAIEQPKPLYKVLSRNTYLDFHYEGVNEIFKAYTIGVDVWFGFGEKPLHWHVPFGVLVDAYYGIITNPPIQMSAHYRSPPFDKIITNNIKITDIPANSFPLVGLKTVKDHFNHSLKEAVQIKFGSTSVIMSDTKAEDSQQLFDSVKSNYMEKYEKLFNAIWFSPKYRVKAMPLRVFIKDYDNMIQKSVPINDQEGKEATLGESLKRIFPKVKFHWDEVEGIERKYQVISQGILLSPEFTISFLVDNFYNLDGFVYISLYSEN